MHRHPWQRWFQVGIVGSVVTVLCCLTPVLGIVLGLLGVGWLAGAFDRIVLPLLLLFGGMIVYAVLQQRRAHMRQEPGDQERVER